MKTLILSIFLFAAVLVHAQDEYVLKVHESKTLLQGENLFLTHTNFNSNGNQPGALISGNRNTRYAVHGSFEFMHGITDNFEVGFVVLTNLTNTYGYHFVGGHIRPKFSAPEGWNLPFGFSLSADLGLQNQDYFASTFGLEIRPVFDKRTDNFYISFNPALNFSFKGIDSSSKPTFIPSFKTSFRTNDIIDLGLEYYGNLNALNTFKNVVEQKHTLFLVADLHIDPDWVVNMGPGIGLNDASNKIVIKLMLGKRLNWSKKD